MNAPPPRFMLRTPQLGMTLMELMLAMALSALVLVALSGFTSLMFRAVQQDERIESQRGWVERVTQRVRLELGEVVAIETATEPRFTYTTSFNPTAVDAAYFRTDVRCDNSNGTLALIYRSRPIATNAQGPQPANATPTSPVEGAKEWVLYPRLHSCRMEYGSLPLPGTQARGLLWQANPGTARARDLVFVRWQVSFDEGAEVPVLFAHLQGMR